MEIRALRYGHQPLILTVGFLTVKLDSFKITFGLYLLNSRNLKV